MKRTGTLVLAVGLGLFAGGCAMFNRTQVQYSRTTTVGRELLDLQEALQKGAVSEAEYNKVRTSLMEGAPVRIDVVPPAAP